jgi:hypothetical protein
MSPLSPGRISSERSLSDQRRAKSGAPPTAFIGIGFDGQHGCNALEAPAPWISHHPIIPPGGCNNVCRSCVAPFIFLHPPVISAPNLPDVDASSEDDAKSGGPNPRIHSFAGPRRSSRSTRPRPDVPSFQKVVPTLDIH